MAQSSLEARDCCHGVLPHPPVRLRRALPPPVQADSALFLRAERQPDGRRNYKLAVKDPLPTSFGEDLYYRLGGWLEETEPYP